VADLRDRLNNCWPKGRTALPPKREIILTPLIATYKGRWKISQGEILGTAVSTNAGPGWAQTKSHIEFLTYNSVEPIVRLKSN